jgi:hypothetical protein
MEVRAWCRCLFARGSHRLQTAQPARSDPEKAVQRRRRALGPARAGDCLGCRARPVQGDHVPRWQGPQARGSCWGEGVDPARCSLAVRGRRGEGRVACGCCAAGRGRRYPWRTRGSRWRADPARTGATRISAGFGPSGVWTPWRSLLPRPGRDRPAVPGWPFPGLGGLGGTGRWSAVAASGSGLGRSGWVGGGSWLSRRLA